MNQQHYCLRWKYHRSNLQEMFSQLFGRGCFCDVTLACEGQTIRAHRVVLCACSSYFEKLLTNRCNEEKDPIIIMQTARFDDVKCLIEFMYKGEINVEHNALTSLLKTAEELCIKGLAEVSWQDEYGEISGNGANGNKSDSVSDEAISVSSNAAIIHMASLSYNEQSVSRNSMAILPSSASSPSHDEKICTLLSTNDNGWNNSRSGTCFRNAQENINNHPNSNNTSTEHACNTLISVASCGSNIGNKIDITARALRIRPLNDEDMCSSESISGRNRLPSIKNTVRNIHSYSSVSSIIPPSKAPLGNSYVTVKKKRGRPPLDKEYKTFQPLPKLTQIERTVCAPFTANSSSAEGDLEMQDLTEFYNEGHTPLDQNKISSLPSIEPKAVHFVEPTSNDSDNMQASWCLKVKSDLAASHSREGMQTSSLNSFEDRSQPCLNYSVLLTPSEEEQWKDVVKMSDYLAKGRRPQFWEEPFTKRVLDGINNKTLEMKKAAKILGVSYGTLYGRYRETYGCLKHPYKGQFMPTSTQIPDMWHTKTSNDTISAIVSGTQHGGIVSTHATELLGDTPSMIMDYLGHHGALH